jgi:hypothetical protein
MALTRADIITAVRRLTRLDNSVPYSDDQIGQFINEAIEELSMLSPFDVYHEDINTTRTIVYTTSERMIDFFGVFYYPLAGSRLAYEVYGQDEGGIPPPDYVGFTTMGAVGGGDGGGGGGDGEIILLESASVFPSSGYAVIGNMFRWEIVRYTGKHRNNLTGVTRGVYGKPLTWAIGTPVHVWQNGVWWNRLEIIPTNSLFDIGAPDDDSVPTKASRQGKTIYLNRYPVEGYGNLTVAGFTIPPLLVKSSDTIRNLENKEMPVVYLAAIKVLTSLGTEEAQRCAQSYMPLFQLELTYLQQQIDRVVRGMTPQTNISMGR